MGKPVTYSAELAGEICEAIASSARGLARICRENERFPAASTVYAWLEAHAEFRERYARARLRQAELLADECLDIADDASEDTVTTARGDVLNREWLQRSKLRVDTRKWMAAKLAPKKYGTEKQEVTHEAGDTLTEFLGRLRGGLEG